ncbi:MAG: nuclear transport factor 2 family protein [Candidatus Andeanibacterium colombiense]|uniref:Nuclear transport factor 2 family protein n=1 Tax=Candidatus Andeanibacterium colombiense TaxID=3121345 RepID=A0AAJ6BN65_9SPHN|nr:MAG: nuclear transport factor 2 family protein [Sphingomonadaceae bacterium]
MKRLLALIVLPALLLGACQLRKTDEGEDRARIHALLVSYGSTLDARDFDGFANLFAKDGVYIAGTGKGVSGRDAGAMMRQVFTENALGFKDPAAHVFFNEVVTLDDLDHAHATSMSLYLVPGADNRPAPAMMARYEDRLVREGGAWKFASRKVISLIPAPPKK